MANFDVAAMALKAVCPSNEILYDDKGLPSVMVRIPKMTYAELDLGSSTNVFPAFVVNGHEIDEIYISKYQNIVHNGRAYSLPGRDPGNTIYGADALAACTAKGDGWHLMTRMEWMAIALWCKKNGTMPKGNNNYGKDTGDSIYQAIPSCPRDASNRIQRVATGTGPLSWSHDGTPSGIWDLNGNVYEWVGGIRTVNGEIQILANNNAADKSNSQELNSDQWKAISGSSGLLITPNGSGTTSGSVKLRWDTNHWNLTTSNTADGTTTYQGCTLESVTYDNSVGAAAQLLLQALGLLKYDTGSGAYGGDYIYANSVEAERGFRCGGHWYGGAHAGVFCAGGDSSFFSLRSGGIGFRSAFVKLPTGT